MRSLICGLLAVQPAVAVAQFPASWTERIEPFQIAENLYYVGTAALAAYLFTSDDGHILHHLGETETGMTKNRRRHHVEENQR